MALSIGFAVSDRDPGSLEDLLRVADMALYAAKRQGAPSAPESTKAPWREGASV